MQSTNMYDSHASSSGLKSLWNLGSLVHVTTYVWIVRNFIQLCIIKIVFYSYIDWGTRCVKLKCLNAHSGRFY